MPDIRFGGPDTLQQVTDVTSASPASQPRDRTAVRALMQAGQFADAANLARELLTEQSAADEDNDLRYMLAVACRYGGDLDRASSVLDDLEALNPGFPRAHQERGHLERRRGRLRRALAAYEMATRLDPALLASWRALAELHQQAGRTQAAKAAFSKFDQLSKWPPELLSATNLLNENRLEQAERTCRAFLQQHKTHVEGMRLLAEIAVRLRILNDAEFLLETALELEPDHVPARVDYLNVLIRKTRFEDAHTQALRLLENDPDNAAFRTSLATTLVGLGRHDEGIRLYLELIEAQPDSPALHLNLGHARKAAGDLEGAIASYRRAYELKPDFGDAYWSLANTKTYRFDDTEMAAMAHREAAAGTRLDDRIHLCFALGKAFEDAGQHAESFRSYARGNALKQQDVRYQDAATQRLVQAQIEVCTPELFAMREGCGHPAADPIFIVGLPRAGSTLLEQILASHSMVDGTLELHDILALAQRLRGRSSGADARYPAILRDLNPEQLQAFGEKYLADTRVYRGQAPLFIDKMPNNFLHIGLIKLILPNAKVIDARRHPMACCFSGFKQLFGEGQEFSYGLHEIGRYYAAYVRLMDHFDEVLPGFVLRVMHEDVVDDLEGQVRRLLDFCGLPFEAGCLEFHKTERSIRTPSSEQVRQPIYRESVEQWRHFEPYLEPLKQALGPDLLERYPC